MSGKHGAGQQLGTQPMWLTHLAELGNFALDS